MKENPASCKFFARVVLSKNLRHKTNNTKQTRITMASKQEEKKQEENPITVTIVGGGNSAHVLIPFLSETHHAVNLLTRRVNDWEKIVKCELHDFDEGVIRVWEGTMNKISSKPADVIPDADIIILCMPVHTYRIALHNLAPHINRTKEVFVGTVYGQAGFNWMAHEMEREHNLTNTVTFSIGLIPWICRISKYGSVAFNYGGKQVNIAAVFPYERFDRLNEIFFNDISYVPLGMGKFVQACSFISLTLSVDNQIVHPGRCYGLWERYDGKWKSTDDVPYFYRDFDEISAECMKRLDSDYTTVRNAIRKHFPERPFKYMLDYLELERLSHKSVNFDIKASLADSKQLAMIKTPVKRMVDGTYMIDTDCRFFTDDFPYGILLTKWIADQLGEEVPFIDELITWVQEIRGDKFLTVDNKIDTNTCLDGKYTTGIPPSYGISSVEDILD